MASIKITMKDGSIREYPHELGQNAPYTTVSFKTVWNHGPYSNVLLGAECPKCGHVFKPPVSEFIRCEKCGYTEPDVQKPADTEAEMTNSHLTFPADRAESTPPSISGNDSDQGRKPSQIEACMTDGVRAFFVCGTDMTRFRTASWYRENR